MIEYKYSITNELATKVFMKDSDDMFGAPNSITIYSINQAISKYPNHSITNIKYYITSDDLKNLTHNWTISMMPDGEFINQ
jgi:hypothetical protein